MYLGICYLDTSDQVFMTDGSALPQAEGEGGVARVIRDSLTPDPESLILSPTESNSLSFEHEAEPEASVPESNESFETVCAYEESDPYTTPSQYMDSSTYDYTNEIDYFSPIDQVIVQASSVLPGVKWKGGATQVITEPSTPLRVRCERKSSCVKKSHV